MDRNVTPTSDTGHPTKPRTRSRLDELDERWRLSRLDELDERWRLSRSPADEPDG